MSENQDSTLSGINSLAERLKKAGIRTSLMGAVGEYIESLFGVRSNISKELLGAIGNTNAAHLAVLGTKEIAGAPGIEAANDNTFQKEERAA